jgi:hypothetical protein
MKFKHSFLLIVLSTICLGIFGQVEETIKEGKKENKEKSPFSERLVFGGDIGLSFGSITYIKLAPVVGYRITNRLTAGVGPIYIYESYKNYDLKTSTYGGKAVASFTILRGSSLPAIAGLGDVVLHAENEVINIEPYYTNGSYYYFGNRLWIDNVLLGGGITQYIGSKFGVSIFILWDVTQNYYSPYSNPIFKFGFSF